MSGDWGETAETLGMSGVRASVEWRKPKQMYPSVGAGKRQRAVGALIPPIVSGLTDQTRAWNGLSESVFLIRLRNKSGF